MGLNKTDEFNQVAKKELDENISAMEKIDNDAVTSLDLDQILKNLHQIKGLATMVNKENVTNIASLLYRILETNKEKPGGIDPKIIHESIVAIRSIFNEKIKIDEKIENQLKEILSK